VPGGTAEAIVVDDPTPGGIRALIVTGLPPRRPPSTPATARRRPSGDEQRRQGGLLTACPPKGEHRYRFTVYALSKPRW
jgi:phosphatidylethanolamine-binding protein (PEBP) family uncharacterized protein